MTVSASVLAELAKALLAAAHQVEESLGAAVRGADLGVAHFLVLHHLHAQGAAATSDLGAIALVPPATLTRVLDKLVDLGLVHRAIDDVDRRRIIVRLTDRGLACVLDTEPAVHDGLAMVFADLQEWQAQAIMDLLAPREAGEHLHR